MNCHRPAAPLTEIANGLKLLSTFATPSSSAGKPSSARIVRASAPSDSPRCSANSVLLAVSSHEVARGGPGAVDRVISSERGTEAVVSHRVFLTRASWSSAAKSSLRSRPPKGSGPLDGMFCARNGRTTTNKCAVRRTATKAVQPPSNDEILALLSCRAFMMVLLILPLTGRRTSRRTFLLREIGVRYILGKHSLGVEE